MKYVTVDGRDVTDRASFHDLLARLLSFPDWYGRNLDALSDCLTSLPEETTLVLENWDDAEAALGPYAARVRRVLEEAETDRLTVTILE